jgi:L-asparaginase
MDLYATGKTLKLAGAVSGHDITTEAALGKLFILLGMSEDQEWVKNRFGEDLFGEISK